MTPSTRPEPSPTVRTLPVRHCPVCESPHATVARAGVPDPLRQGSARWTFLQCVECGVVYLSERPVDLADAYPEQYRQHRVPAATPSELRTGLRGRARRAVLAAYGYPGRPARPAARLAARIPDVRLRACYGFQLLPPGPGGGRLLDVGCGNGRFLVAASRFGWEVEGVEPDPASRALALRAAVKVHEHIHDRALDRQRFDVITLTHSLEHVERPVEVLRRCRELTAAGGMVGIAVPNWPAAAHRMLGERWQGLDPPRHLVMFDRANLTATLLRAGLRVVGTSTRSLRSNMDALRLADGSLTAPGRVARGLACVLMQLASSEAGGEVVAWATPAHP